MKQSLFSIGQEYVHLAEALIENGGECTPELEQALSINKQELETKGINYGFIIKQIEAEKSIIDAEIERLQNLKKQRNNAVDRLKNNLLSAMDLFGFEKIESPVLKISIRKSESVEIEDETLINKKFIVEKISKSTDKAAIKEAIKTGEIVAGARLQSNKNLQIK